MLKDFRTVLEPGDLWTWIALGYTQKRNFMAEHVFIIEVGGLKNFRTLQIKYTEIPSQLVFSHKHTSQTTRLNSLTLLLL